MQVLEKEDFNVFAFGILLTLLMLIYMNVGREHFDLLVPGIPVIWNQILGIVVCSHRLYVDKNFSSDFQKQMFLRRAYIWFMQLIVFLCAIFASQFLAWFYTESTLVNLLNESDFISDTSKFVRSTKTTKKNSPTPHKLILFLDAVLCFFCHFSFYLFLQ